MVEIFKLIATYTDFDTRDLNFVTPTVSSIGTVSASTPILNGNSGAGATAGLENFLYRYNGKEQVQDLNIGLYEYGFRWYDAQTAKFVQVDPLADKYAYKSTFDYAENSPLSNIDLDGLESWKTTDGKLLNGPFSKQYIQKNNLKKLEFVRIQKQNSNTKKDEKQTFTQKANDVIKKTAEYSDAISTFSGPLLTAKEATLSPTEGWPINRVGYFLEKVGTAADGIQLVYAISENDASGIASSGADLILENPGVLRFIGLSEFAASTTAWTYFGIYKLGWGLLDSDWNKGNAARDLNRESLYYYQQGIKYQNTGNQKKADEYFERASKTYKVAEKIVNDIKKDE